MQAIKLLLIKINESMGKIAKVEYYKGHGYNSNYQMGSSVQGMGNNMQDNKDDDIEFTVDVLPTEIIGVPILWKIILEAKSE